MSDIKELLEACKKAQDEYFKYGITTVQEGMFLEELIPIYKEMIKEEILKIDVATYMDIKSKEKIEKEFPDNIKKYYNNMKIQGYKIFLDGSPQLRTAWMKTPYKTDNINKYEKNSKPTVVVTTFSSYDFVRQIAEDKVNLVFLLGPRS